MAIRFRTHISSSRGNCIQIDCDGATLLLDCGFTSQRACNAVLDGISGELLVLVSHSHRDHLSYAGLTALAKRGVEVRAHHLVLDELTERHDFYGKHVPKLSAFTGLPTYFGPFCVRPIPVRHAPGIANFAFVVECGSGYSRRKLVVCTDLNCPQDIALELPDSDLIYLESNHDPELLRRHWNYASTFHLSNPKAGELLCRSLRSSRRLPRAIMLGHLSQERNIPELALETIRECFQRDRQKLSSPLSAAPALAPSSVIHID